MVNYWLNGYHSLIALASKRFSVRRAVRCDASPLPPFRLSDACEYPCYREPKLSFIMVHLLLFQSRSNALINIHKMYRPVRGIKIEIQLGMIIQRCFEQRDLNVFNLVQPQRNCIYRNSRGCCCCCSSEIEFNLSFDYVFPLSRARHPVRILPDQFLSQIIHWMIGFSSPVLINVFQLQIVCASGSVRWKKFRHWFLESAPTQMNTFLCHCRPRWKIVIKPQGEREGRIIFKYKMMNSQAIGGRRNRVRVEVATKWLRSRREAREREREKEPIIHHSSVALS